MAKVGYYIIKKNGLWYVGSRNDSYSHEFNKAYHFGEDRVVNRKLILDLEDVLLKVEKDGTLTETRYDRRKSY